VRGFLRLVRDPAVERELRGFRVEARDAGRAVELHEARRIPELGGEVAIAFDALGRELDVAPLCGHRGQREAQRVRAEITAAIEAYRFNEAAGAAYRFVWNVYCDWYVELSKPVLTGPDGDAKAETRAMACWVLDEIIRLLHPFMPFITEELWSVAPGPAREDLLVLSAWPQLEGLDAPDAEAEIGWVIDLITAIRSLRAEMNINIPIPLELVGATAQGRARAERWSEFLTRLARLSGIGFADTPQKGAVQLVVRGEVATLPLMGLIDLAAEKARLEKEMVKVESDLKRIDAQLGNPAFVAKAPEEKIELERERREEALARREKITEALERLRGAA